MRFGGLRNGVEHAILAVCEHASAAAVAASNSLGGEKTLAHRLRGNAIGRRIERKDKRDLVAQWNGCWWKLSLRNPRRRSLFAFGGNRRRNFGWRCHR